MRLSVMVAMGLLVAAIFSGCVIVPVSEHHDEGRYGRRDDGERHYQYHSSLSRPSAHEDR
jgi:hypothetical protein